MSDNEIIQDATIAYSHPLEATGTPNLKYDPNNIVTARQRQATIIGLCSTWDESPA